MMNISRMLIKCKDIKKNIISTYIHIDLLCNLQSIAALFLIETTLDSTRGGLR